MHHMVKACCQKLRRSWRTRGYHSQLILLSLLISMYIVIVEGEPFWNHKLQRRFMWKHMDNTMNGLMGGMKSMINDFLPTTQTTVSMVRGNLLDHLPAETTRVKYIIRNPNKPMKIIRMRTPKKVMKIINIPPVKSILENKINNSKVPRYQNTNTLHNSEKEEIFDGLFSFKNTSVDIKLYEDPNDKNLTTSAKTNEFGNDWIPVYETDKQAPISFSTTKPHAMSSLHTSIVGHHLAQPKKQIIEQDDQELEPESQPLMNTQKSYEVIEHVAEETISLPLVTSTQYYHNSKSFLPAHGKPYVSNRSSTISASNYVTSTSEPNYPAPFKKINRERISKALLLQQSDTKPRPTEITLDTSWIPYTNVTAYPIVRTQQQHQQRYRSNSTDDSINIEVWPVSTSVTPPSTLTMLPTTSADMDSTIKILEPLGDQTRFTKKNVKFNLTLEKIATKPKDVRQRGSIKFGDKIIVE